MIRGMLYQPKYMLLNKKNKIIACMMHKESEQVNATLRQIILIILATFRKLN